MITTVFAATTPEKTPFAYRASTSTNPNPMISPAFVEKELGDLRKHRTGKEAGEEGTPKPMYAPPNMPMYPNTTGSFIDSTGFITPFVRWIEDNPLPDGLKMPSHIGSYNGKRDPDNFLHLFKGSIRMKNGRDRFSPYRGPNHGLLSNRSKSTREILATEKAAKSFEQHPRMFRSRRSRDMSKYCHFHEDYGHDTNDFRQLRNQIEEAVKSGLLSHLVKGIKKEKVIDAPTLPVSAEKNLGDPIKIKVDIVHPAPADVFPAATVVRTLAQHGEAIRGIHGHLQGVPICNAPLRKEDIMS
nr:hypothetical protein [Tanacetum cinerariifolium]